jgi:phage shock protein A
VRSDLAQISADEPPQGILRRIEQALQLIEGDAARLHERGETERRTAEEWEERAIEAVKAGDDSAARHALERQNDHQTLAMQHFDDAVQLKWLLTQYRTAADKMQVRAPGEPGN